jgi:DNA polymerase
MNKRRDAILAEMGLAPIWRRRKKAAAALPPVPEGAAAAASRATIGAAAAPDAREAAIAAMDMLQLKHAVVGCTACGLEKTRTQTVFGVGDERAEWLLVGEAPGAEEDRLGEPFVGQAGKLLDNMLAAIDLRRGENVYIANVLKCRPPGNRNPQPDEVAKCTPYLLRQIGLIRPRLIVAMGRFAAQTLLNTDATIASLRGKVHRYAGVPLIVTYHPAYLLRNLPDKAKAWADLVFARRTMTDLKRDQ